jgi:hypothetical protein
MDENADKFWDPLGQDIDEDDFKLQQTSLAKNYQKYLDNPNLFTHYLIAWLTVPLLFLIFILINPNLLEFRYKLEYFVFSFIPAMFFYFHVSGMEEQMTIYLLCQ